MAAADLIRCLRSQTSFGPGSHADPSRTARELLTRLKATHSGNPAGYQDAVLRTLQRRLKIWRADMAQELVFGRSERSGASNGPERCEC